MAGPLFPALDVARVFGMKNSNELTISGAVQLMSIRLRINPVSALIPRASTAQLGTGAPPSRAM